jgi:hypothetical protein
MEGFKHYYFNAATARMPSMKREVIGVWRSRTQEFLRKRPARIDITQYDVSPKDRFVRAGWDWSAFGIRQLLRCWAT